MRGGDTRFAKGTSGNPAGRPKGRRQHVSAFDIIFEQTLTVTQNGVERELTVDEALEFQTYQAALKGSKMAVRAVLKMIEKREAALAKLAPQQTNPIPLGREYDSANANDAMVILGITEDMESPPNPDPDNRRLKLATWAAQAAISRPGRKPVDDKDISEVKRVTIAPDTLKWPRHRRSR
jgi:hypothetical protein